MKPKYLFVRTDLDGASLPLKYEREALAGFDAVELVGKSCATDDEVIAAAADADALLTNESYITRRVLSSLPKLRAVVRYGIGFDRVDLEAATENGIAVVNVPDFCQTELAQYVVLGVLAWNKRLIPMNREVQAGDWVEARKRVSRAMGPTVGQKLGIYGFGNAGRAVARLAQALGMEILSCSGHLSDADRAMGVQAVSRDELFATCDFLSINCALNAQTRHAIGARELGLMKPTAVIINTARGPLIDEPALIDALQCGRIAGAVLDVLEQEPPEADNPLLKLPNVILTPHVSYYSSESVRKLATSVIEGALNAVLPERVPKNVVNREVLDRPNCRV